MPLEIELKMRLKYPEVLEAKLGSLGANFLGAVLERNTYYDTVGSDLRHADQGLRLRIEQPTDSGPSRVIVTHKGPRLPGPTKTRQETQVHVSDPGSAAELLEAIGYCRVLSFEKRRRRWQLEGCSIEIDCLPYLGDFVEIEGPDEQAILAARATIQMGEVPLIRKSYLGLLREYLDENGLAQTCVTFACAEGENGVLE